MIHVPHTCALGFAALMLASAPAVAGHGGGHGGGGHGGGFHGGGGFHHGGGFHGGGFHGGGFHHFHHGFTTFGVFGFGPSFGFPYYYDYPYPYPYDYGPGAYVAPSPLYSVPSLGQCRTFNGDAVIAGSNQPFFGTACWQPDGAWHIVQ